MRKNCISQRQMESWPNVTNGQQSDQSARARGRWPFMRIVRRIGPDRNLVTPTTLFLFVVVVVEIDDWWWPSRLWPRYSCVSWLELLQSYTQVRAFTKNRFQHHWLRAGRWPIIQREEKKNTSRRSGYLFLFYFFSPGCAGHLRLAIADRSLSTCHFSPVSSETLISN